MTDAIKNMMDQWDGTAFPQMIRGLPEIDVPLEGVRGWLLQAGDQQVVFFDIQPIGEIPPHSHGAQWGIMVEGEMELSIGGEARRIRKGDWYYIPTGATHSAVFKTRVSVIDIFDEPARYLPKKP